MSEERAQALVMDTAEARMDTVEMAAVRLEGLTKSYGSLRAVDALTLAIRPGETVALLGPNGAGKTTTVSMLLGLLTPDSGSAMVLGMTPNEAIHSGRIGAMLQEGNLMPGVRIGELLDYVLSLRSSSMTRAELLEMAHLNGLEKRRIDRLSGGQTQRVLLAIALAFSFETLDIAFKNLACRTTAAVPFLYLNVFAPMLVTIWLIWRDQSAKTLRRLFAPRLT